MCAYGLIITASLADTVCLPLGINANHFVAKTTNYFPCLCVCRCEFIVNATREVESSLLPRPKGRAGHVLSPRHTLPPNTTCSYRFQGQPGDLVWIYFVSYSHRALMPPPDPDAGIPPVIPLVPENSTTTTLSDPTASPAPGTVDNQGKRQKQTKIANVIIMSF